MDHPINIHLTGCPNSCAQHYLGEIGLLGTGIDVGDDLVEGYRIFVGGGYGEQRNIGREVCRGVPATEAPRVVEKMLQAYLRHRLGPEEEFNAFVSRHPPNSCKPLFAQALAGFGVELVSTGGTAKALRAAGLLVKDISELTGFPEMLDGRVKTLHPRVHGGLLYIRGNAGHEAAVKAHSIEPIDMVVVNLYAFEKTAAQPGVAFGHLIENIDIGGPSMVRSAAKNFEDVAIVTRVADYPALINEMKGLQEMKSAPAATLTRATRWRLAKQAFALTSAYDAAIANTLEKIADAPAPEASAAFDDASLPATLRINMPQAQALRYGENPHQRAALYADGSGLGIAGARQLQGKELSFNNLVDLDACWELVQEFEEPAVIIVKHTNPCGAATGADILEAYQKALAADPVSAFGGVIGINREVDGAAAEEIAKLFVEAIAAPAFSAERAGALCGQEESAPGGSEDGAGQARGQAGVGRVALAGCRHGRVDGVGAEGGDVASADGRGDAQPALRLARRETREIECHCVRARRANPGRGCGTDEPGGRGQVRRHEGRAAAARGGLCGGVGRVLSLPRWAGGRGRRPERRR